MARKYLTIVFYTHVEYTNYMLWNIMFDWSEF